MGGGERVVTVIIQVLNRLGFEVTVYSEKKFSPEQIEMAFNRHVEICEVIAPKQIDLYRTPVYLRTYASLLNEFLLRRIDDEDLFIDMSGGALPAYSRIPDISYIVTPTSYFELFHEYCSGSIMRRLYLRPYVNMVRWLLSRLSNIKIVYCVNRYTQEMLPHLGLPQIETRVLYPPTNIAEWKPKKESARQGVISVARFAPRKRHDWQVAIMNGIKEELLMVGAASDQEEQNVLQSIRQIAPSNVKISLSRLYTLKDSLWKSKVFLNTADGQPGISIVEAIAAGCIPLVHDSGGAEEIVPISELRFQTIDEARSKLKMALNGKFDHHLEYLQKHIQQFDEKVFQHSFSQAIEEIIK
jgi:glycosyltransferase involved in cell wall biosynthesis